MRAYLLASVVAAMLCLPAAASADHAAPASVEAAPAPTALQALLTRAVRQFQTGDYDAALRNFKTAMDDPGYAGLPVAQRFSILVLRAGCEGARRQAQAALRDLNAAAGLAPERRDAGYWRMYFYAGWGASDYDAMAAATQAVATQFPDMVDVLPIHGLYALFDRLRLTPTTAPQRRALLQALRKADYKPLNPLWDGEGLWLQLFKLDVAANDAAEARALVSHFRDPSSYIAIQSDRRYAAYLDAFQPADFQAVSDAKLARRRADAASYPTRAEAVVYLSNALLERGRADEALPLVEAALAKIAAAPKDKPPFDDDVDQSNWLRDARANLLNRLGRHDEALAMQVAARDAAQAEMSDTVSHTINLADAYNAVGQPQKALDIMKDLDEAQATPYGRMAAAETRVCAYAQLQDKRRVDDLMAYMRAHAADGPDAMRTALICTDDQEGLAAVYLKQLDDPDLRGEALGEAQTYIEPAHQTPYEARMRAALHRMLARPEVRTAIAKYGFVNSYSLVR